MNEEEFEELTETEDFTSEIYGEPEEHDDGGEPYGDLTPKEWFRKHWPDAYDYYYGNGKH